MKKGLLMGEPKAANSKIWLVGIIAVALIGCLGAIMAALIGILPKVIETRTKPPPTDIITDITNTRPPMATDVPPLFEPTNTEPPPATDLPTSPTLTDTPPDTILESGQIWRQGGLELYLASTELFTGSMCEGPGVVLRFYLSNNRTSEVLISLRPDTFSAVDNMGNRFKLIWVNENAHFWGEIDESFVLEPSSTVPLPDPRNDIEVICIQADVANPAISEFTVTVSNLSSINDAKWRVPINR
jgi:hypothetical protein